MSCVETVLQNLHIDDDFSRPLDDDRARGVIEQLERAVNRYRFDQPDYSVELAQLVIQIGTLRDELPEIALGTMLYADSLAQSGSADYQTAWDKLDEAAALYRDCGDDLGWARTRIGRLAICYEVKHVDEALADTIQAEEIFVAHDRQDKLLTLCANKAFVYGHLGDYEDALLILQQVLGQAQAMGEHGEGYISVLYRSIGYNYSCLGDLEKAQHYYELAYEANRAKGWQSDAVTSSISLAFIAIARGDYHAAMRLLLDTDFLAENGGSKRLQLQFVLTRAELDLELNRYETAYELAHDAAALASDMANYYYEAYALMLIGSAQLGSHHYEQASDTFARAEALFAQLGSATWLAMAWLRQGLAALRQRDTELARQTISAAADRFEIDQRKIDLAQARLLQVETLLQSGELETAQAHASQSLALAQEVNSPTLKYQAEFLLGQLAQAQAQPQQAINHYRSACEMIWYVQRALTITVRPDFMVDKHGAVHALIGLLLDQDDTVQAFETIERMKAQIVLNEFANRSNLRWQAHTDRSRAMIAELDKLRAEHQYVYRILNPPPTEHGSGNQLTDDQRGRLSAENSTREHKMQQLTETLYLEATTTDHRQLIDVPDLACIQECLPESATMIAYYNDAATIWGFVIKKHEIRVQRLSITVAHSQDLLNHIYDKMDFALDACDDPALLEQLTQDIQALLHDLYEAILHPLLERVSDRKQLLIVPYGLFHYLPFSALYDGQQYLIEQYDVSILPAASLVTRSIPRHDTIQARVIGHSWKGYLSSVIDEARMVNQLCGGDLYLDEDATVDVLAAPACKILHICAHGEFRIDRPEISYVQLEDAQLYTDDLLQNDMHYELVVLSACETGRANIAPGDELIGLGRGFLYAGAGAVLTTLWRIESSHTVSLMRGFYERLLAGDSISHALCQAQATLLANPASQHPVFWAPFQLTGYVGSQS